MKRIIFTVDIAADTLTPSHWGATGTWEDLDSEQRQEISRAAAESIRKGILQRFPDASLSIGKQGVIDI